MQCSIFFNLSYKLSCHVLCPFPVHTSPVQLISCILIISSNFSVSLLFHCFCLFFFFPAAAVFALRPHLSQNENKEPPQVIIWFSTFTLLLPFLFHLPSARWCHPRVRRGSAGTRVHLFLLVTAAAAAPAAAAAAAACYRRRTPAT